MPAAEAHRYGLALMPSQPWKLVFTPFLMSRSGMARRGTDDEAARSREERHRPSERSNHRELVATAGVCGTMAISIPSEEDR
jgi:hypothetical protein